jgi:hypothetical protein
MRLGLINSADLLQRVGKIIVCLRKVRFDGERLLISFYRLVMASQPGKRDAKMLVGVGGPPIEFDGLPKQLRGIAKPPLLQPDQAEAIQRIEVAIVDGKDDLVALLRFPEATLTVEDNRFLEREQGRCDIPVGTRELIRNHLAFLRWYRQSTKLTELSPINCRRLIETDQLIPIN